VGAEVVVAMREKHDARSLVLFCSQRQSAMTIITLAQGTFG